MRGLAGVCDRSVAGWSTLTLAGDCRNGGLMVYWHCCSILGAVALSGETAPINLSLG